MQSTKGIGFVHGMRDAALIIRVAGGDIVDGNGGVAIGAGGPDAAGVVRAVAGPAEVAGAGVVQHPVAADGVVVVVVTGIARNQGAAAA